MHSSANSCCVICLTITPTCVQERKKVRKLERKTERGGTVEEVVERNGHRHVWHEREMHKSGEGKKAAGGERRGGLLRYHFPPSTPSITPSDPPLFLAA